MILVGLRGVGKTVLLNRIWEAAKDDGFKSVLIEAHEDKRIAELLIPPLRQILFSLDAQENVSDKVKRGFRVLSSFIKGLKVKISEIEVSIDPELGVGDSGDLEVDLGELFVAIGEAAADRKTAVAICVDELQYLDEKELSALIMAIHRINQRNLPLTLIGAGLPQIVGLTGRSKSYAERLFDFPHIGKLNEHDSASALQSPVRSNEVEFTEEAIQEILRETQGYPYFCNNGGMKPGTLPKTRLYPWTTSKQQASWLSPILIKVSFAFDLIDSRLARRSICAPWLDWEMGISGREISRPPSA